MAYQPLEMNARPPILDAMAQVSQSLGQLGDQRHAQALEAQARKRQDFADFQAAYIQAKKLADSGDHQGAAAYMARYKGRYGESPTAHATPAAPTQQQGPQGTPQGGSPMPDAMEFPRMPQEEGPDGVGPDGRPVQPPIDPGFVDSLPMGAPPPPGPQAPNPLMAAAQAGRPQAPADHPLVAANEASKARDQQRGNGVLYFTPPGEGGQEMSYDPTAVREQHIAQRTAEVERMVAKASPEVRAVYEELAPALAMNDQLDVGDVAKLIGKRMDEKQQAATATARAHEGELNREQRGDLRGQQFEVSRRGQNMLLQGNLAKAGAAGPGNPLRVDAANLSATGKLEATLKDFVSMADGKSLVRSNRALNSAITNISAKGPDAVSAHKDAFLQLERQFKGGGVPTDAESRLLLHHLGGWKGALEQFAADADTGDFSDITKQNLARAAQLAKGELDKNLNDLMSGLGDALGPGSEFEGMGSNVNRKIKALGKTYGLDLPDLYQGEAGKRQVILGSGERNPAAGVPAAKAPKRRAAAPAKASKSNEDYWNEAGK